MASRCPQLSVRSARGTPSWASLARSAWSCSRLLPPRLTARVRAASVATFAGERCALGWPQLWARVAAAMLDLRRASHCQVFCSVAASVTLLVIIGRRARAQVLRAGTPTDDYQECHGSCHRTKHLAVAGPAQVKHRGCHPRPKLGPSQGASFSSKSGHTGGPNPSRQVRTSLAQGNQDTD